MRRVLGIALVALALTVGFAPASQASTVSGNSCTDRGITNYYVHHWQNFPAWKILHSPMRFHEHRCHTPQGFRLYKSTADTPQEVHFQRHFLRTDRPEKPTIFCPTSPGHAYFLDLAFYWGMGNIHHLSLQERNHYTQWTHKYAAAHGCRLFLPSPPLRMSAVPTP